MKTGQGCSQDLDRGVPAASEIIVSMWAGAVGPFGGPRGFELEGDVSPPMRNQTLE